MKTKLKAYTLMEVLLALIITSLIVVFMYTIYLYLDKQMLTYQKNAESLMNQLILDDSLQYDIHASARVEYFENKIIFRNYDGKSVIYSNNRDSLYREDSNGLKNMNVKILKSGVQKKYGQMKVAYQFNFQLISNRDTLVLSYNKFAPNFLVN